MNKYFLVTEKELEIMSPGARLSAELMRARAVIYELMEHINKNQIGDNLNEEVKRVASNESLAFLNANKRELTKKITQLNYERAAADSRIDQIINLGGLPNKEWYDKRNAAKAEVTRLNSLTDKEILGILGIKNA